MIVIINNVTKVSIYYIYNYISISKINCNNLISSKTFSLVFNNRETRNRIIKKFVRHERSLKFESVDPNEAS